MFHLVGQFFFGLVIGTIAKLVLPSRGPGGVLVTALIGLMGSAIGTLASYLILEPHRPISHLGGWLLSTLGSVAMLALYHLAFGKRPEYRQELQPVNRD